MLKLLVFAEEFWENVYVCATLIKTGFSSILAPKHCLTCVASREALSQVCTLLSSEIDRETILELKMLGRLVAKVFWWLLTRGWLPDSILRYPE